jgi:hypothetical protein
MRQPSEVGVGAAISAVADVAAQAQGPVETGDGRGVLAALDIATEAFMTVWEELDDSDGELTGFFEELEGLGASAPRPSSTDEHTCRGRTRPTPWRRHCGGAGRSTVPWRSPRSGSPMIGRTVNWRHGCETVRRSKARPSVR